jgi:hypothetical protein
MFGIHTPLSKGISIALCLILFASGCGTAVVQIRAPFHPKLRNGDGVKITTSDGIIHSGRIVYIDNSVIVIKTPKQVIVEKPVKTSKFGTTIPWESVKQVKVAGTLDGNKKLISNEEIRINRRTNSRRNMGINIGLLGMAVSFLAGVRIQDSVSPASIDPTIDSHGRARIAFWTTFIGGTVASILTGYKIGERMDRQRSIDRIERFRVNLRKAQGDTLARPDQPQTSNILR